MQYYPIFQVNGNVIRQTPSTAHFRARSWLAFLIYVNVQVYYGITGTEFRNSAGVTVKVLHFDGSHLNVFISSHCFVLCT